MYKLYNISHLGTNRYSNLNPWAVQTGFCLTATTNTSAQYLHITFKGMLSILFASIKPLPTVPIKEKILCELNWKFEPR